MSHKIISFIKESIKIPIFIKYLLIGCIPFLILCYFLAAFLANSFNILKLNEEIKITFVIGIFIYFIICSIASLMAADN